MLARGPAPPHRRGAGASSSALRASECRPERSCLWAPVEAVMEPGPSTVRGDSHLEPLAELRRRRYLTSLSVTTPDGVLLGVVRRDDLEATLASGQP